VSVDWRQVAEHSPIPQAARREPWNEMAMIYTSGTTGPSKGVLCSYLHHYAYASHLLPGEIGRTDRFYLCTPLSHVAGTAALVGMVIRGGGLVVVEGFSASRFWDDIRAFEVTTTFFISSMATSLSKQPASDRDADNPLRSAYMAPLLPDVREFETRFGVSIYTGFGMTEVPTATHSGFSPQDTRSCGRAVDPECYELRIVDDSDIEVPDGTVGELILRHRYPWVLNSGYKDMPAATAEAWRNGWFHTGDYMIRNEGGEYFIIDRKKDVIRRRGESISSVEVEKALTQYPTVIEAAVVGVRLPDATDEEVMAVLVVRDGFEPAELITFLVPRLPDFMVPRFVDIVPELPKTPSLKVAKYALRVTGIRATTWDRVAAGIEVPRERIGR
jgi:crotonobetaine/carnitine-CoA ligase